MEPERRGRPRWPATAVADQRPGSAHGLQLRGAPGQRTQAQRTPRAGGDWSARPDIPGVGQRRGNDVLHCLYCHGYEVRDQPIGVLGALAPKWHCIWP